MRLPVRDAVFSINANTKINTGRDNKQQKLQPEIILLKKITINDTIN